MSSLQTIIAPSRVGGFVFRGTIGEGAFSVVKLAFHEQFNQFFACKIVPRNRINLPDLERRFEDEIRINQQMHHPGVVQIIDLLKDEVNFYIFMEFCPNGELFRHIVNHQRLPEAETASVAYQILTTLAYVHSLGVAHRDLKPENLLLDVNGRIKISDFGLSRFVGPNGLVNTPCGSPCYASPECLSGCPYDGRKSDIWSCGVILYACVTGQLPWTKKNKTQLFAQIKKGEYTIPPYVSDNCRSLISGLLTVDSDKRLSVEDALKHPFLDGIKGGIEMEQQLYSIVSLKKVDDFFDKSSGEDEGLQNLSMPRQTSQLPFSMPNTIKIITSKAELTIFKARTRTFSVPAGYMHRLPASSQMSHNFKSLLPPLQYPTSGSKAMERPSTKYGTSKSRFRSSAILQ